MTYFLVSSNKKAFVCFEKDKLANHRIWNTLSPISETSAIDEESLSSIQKELNKLNNHKAMQLRNGKNVINGRFLTDERQMAKKKRKY